MYLHCKDFWKPPSQLTVNYMNENQIHSDKDKCLHEYADSQLLIEVLSAFAFETIVTCFIIDH